MRIRTSISALNPIRARQLNKQSSGEYSPYVKRTRRSWKSTTVAMYIAAFLFIISIVAVGYEPPKRSTAESVANAVAPQALASTRTEMTAPSVDQLVATRVAAGVAERAELPIAPNIAQVSLTLSIESQLAQADNNVITKPQIIQPSADSREIRSYTTVAGDSVDKLAARFGVSPETIKWANSLTSDALEPGRTLQIPPINGVIYTVKDGDTAHSIAEKYNADERRIVLYNDLEDGLKPGQKIILPDGDLPTTERPDYVAPRPTPAYNSYSGTVIGSYSGGTVGNRYAFGNCTYYAYDRRAELGRPIGSFWGNASTWAAAARASGYAVNNVPEVGAVAQWNAYSDAWIGYYGHVAIVESVNGDGTITISEMNNVSLGGYNIVNRRTIPASSVSNYIH